MCDRRVDRGTDRRCISSRACSVPSAKSGGARLPAISRERTACAPARKKLPHRSGAELRSHGVYLTEVVQKASRGVREKRNAPPRNGANAQTRRDFNGGPHSRPARLPCPARSGPSADRATASGPVLASGGASAPVARFAGGEGLVLFLYTFERVIPTQVASTKTSRMAWGGPKTARRHNQPKQIAKNWRSQARPRSGSVFPL